MAKAVIEATNLTKTYNGFTAVDRLNLRVDEGEIFGFLGPNGAGKTTTILMLLGLTEPTSGIARVSGFNSTREPLKVKRLAAYLPETHGLYEDLTARENLRYVARLNEVPDRQSQQEIPELLALVGIPKAVDQRVETFSKGMKQRLGIAGVLIKRPKVVFLDEPTAGLDPEGANFLLNLIVKMSREQQMTIMLSSHLLHQVQRICHRVGIISKGRLVAEGPIERLTSEAKGRSKMTVELELGQVDRALADSIRRISGVTSVETSGNSLIVGCEKDVRVQISRAVLESRSSLMQMKQRGYGLEEIYMRYFQEGAG